MKNKTQTATQPKETVCGRSHMQLLLSRRSMCAHIASLKYGPALPAGTAQTYSGSAYRICPAAFDNTPEIAPTGENCSLYTRKIMRMPVRMVHLSTLRRKCLRGTVGIAAIVMRIRMCTDLLPGRCSNFMYQLRRIQDLSRAFFAPSGCPMPSLSSIRAVCGAAGFGK